MADNRIFRKTEKGSEEIVSRKYKLAPKLRTILILMDGKTSVDTLAEVTRHMGLPDDYLAYMEKEGFISALDADSPYTSAPGTPGEAGAGSVAASGPAASQNPVTRFRQAQRFMNNTVVDAIGVRSFFFTLKLERCSTTNELAELLGEYTRLIAKGDGEDMAALLTERARDLLE
jgi:hypothetical protein